MKEFSMIEKTNCRIKTKDYLLFFFIYIVIFIQLKQTQTFPTSLMKGNRKNNNPLFSAHKK